jgi:prophage antirepressor-like protein
MGILPTTLTFGSSTLTIIDRLGEPWVTARDLAKALGYRTENAVLRIYARNREEFTDEMTTMIHLGIQGQIDPSKPRKRGNPNIRVFSPRGCYAVGFFSKTDRAKDFRRWVLDVLEQHTRGGGPECRLTPLLAMTRARWGHGLTADGYSAVSLNIALVLDWLLIHCADGRWREISNRQLGAAVGISNTSAAKALYKLADWGLIQHETDGTRCTRIRVHTRRLRQALKHANLSYPGQRTTLLN